MPPLGVNPFAIAAVAWLCAMAAARYGLRGRPRTAFLTQAAGFAGLTALLRAGHIEPDLLDGAAAHATLAQIVNETLEAIWCFVAASLARGFIRGFVLIGRKQSEVVLVQELLGAMVYLAALIAVFAYVLNWPIKGLLATSGALAIVVGLALQSTLGDAFSGIILNLERPYRVGDWISVDAGALGRVVETNWRTTHIRTGSNDLAIVPNSTIAKSRIVNCSENGQLHKSSLRVRLDRRLTPDVGSDLMKDVLRGCSGIVHEAEPGVSIVEISAAAVGYELGFAVRDVSVVDDVKADLLRRAFYAVCVNGGGFAPSAEASQACQASVRDADPHDIAGAIPLFRSLTPAECAALLKGKTRRTYRSGQTLAERGTLMGSLVIVARGVVVAWEEEGDTRLEGVRWTPGFYFGELGLLTGEALSGDVTALTAVVTYEISREALAPLLKARPEVVEELGERLERDQETRRGVHPRAEAPQAGRISVAGRVADTIRHWFAIP